VCTLKQTRANIPGQKFENAKRFISLTHDGMLYSAKMNEERGYEMPDIEVLNTAELLSRVEGDEELLAELIDVFLADSGEMLLCVSDALTRQDAAGVERAAHKVKGSVSIFCSRTATQTAQVLEAMGRDQDLSRAPEIFAQLERQVEMLKQAMIELKGTACPKS
jgi:HPt (histidine-containing phosphotransfer) domain-containing protein